MGNCETSSKDYYYNNNRQQPFKKLNIDDIDDDPNYFFCLYDPLQYIRNIRYDDDQPLSQKAIAGQTHLKDYDYFNNIDLQVKPVKNGYQSSQNGMQQVPYVISVSSKDQQGNNQDRLPVDLFCVIDHSGSMGGEKMNLVRTAMTDLLKIMQKDDRLCIIEFDHRGVKCSPLIRTYRKNKMALQRIINNFDAKGGTNINLGMVEAFKSIKGRKMKNPVTGVFILSDGEDTGADQKVMNSFQQFNFGDEKFIIDTFGFGHEHCSQVMSNIARFGHGNYYFIEELEQIDEFLYDAVCSLMSTILEDVQIKVQVTDQPEQMNNFIGKTYGDQWQENGNQQHVLQMNNLISGVNKDYVHEMYNYPVEEYAKQDLKNNNKPTIVSVQLQAKIPGTDQIISKEAKMELKHFFNDDLEYQQLKEDPETMAHYHRVVAAEAMEQALLRSHQGQHIEAIDLLHEILQEIKRCKKSDKKRLRMLMQDLELCKLNCQEDKFHRIGKHHLTAKIKQHIEQRSHGDGDQCQYSNNFQKMMVQTMKNRK